MISVLDLDGTIIDSTKRHWYLLKKIMIEMNINLPLHIDTEYVEYKRNGKSTHDYLKSIGISENVSKDISKRWTENIEKKYLTDMDCLYDDSIRFLKTLNSKQYKIYFLSNRNNIPNLISTLERLDIKKYAYDIVVTSPKSGYFQKADFLINLAKMNENEDLFLVGDTEIDYNAAKTAMTKSFILNRGFRNKSYWMERNIESYNTLDEILEVLI